MFGLRSTLQWSFCWNYFFVVLFQAFCYELLLLVETYEIIHTMSKLIYSFNQMIFYIIFMTINHNKKFFH